MRGQGYLAAIIACVGAHAAAGISCSTPSSKSIAGPLVPKRVDVSNTPAWHDALDVLFRDGAVVLQGVGNPSIGNRDSFRDIAAALPTRLLMAGNESSGRQLQLLSPNAPVNAVHDELRELKKRGLYLPGSGLEPHTDGYVYGDDLPDFVFLVCERPSLLGGANVLLDGMALLHALDGGDSEERELAAWLVSTPVDLSEPAETGVVGGRLAEGPIVQWHSMPSGDLRLKWRRQINVDQTQQLDTWAPLRGVSSEEIAGKRCANLNNQSYLSLWRPLPSINPEHAVEVQSKLRAFDSVIQRASAVAFAEHSFKLSRGEALVVDNYRVLHGRAPYQPPTPQQSDPGAGDASNDERRLWRVWSWTSAGTGLPPDGARTSHPFNHDIFEVRKGAPLKTDL